MLDRQCAKATCSRPAEHTLTYDYTDSMMVLGPLGYVAQPHSYDLCGAHADRLRAPGGWQLIRHSVLGGTDIGRDLDRGTLATGA